MIDTTDENRCRTGCWTIAAGFGVLSFLLSMIVAHRGFFTSLILAILVIVCVGFLLNWLFCAKRPEAAQTSTSSDVNEGAAASAQYSASTSLKSADVAASAAVTSAAASTNSATPPKAETENAVAPVKSDDDTSASETAKASEEAAKAETSKPAPVETPTAQDPEPEKAAKSSDTKAQAKAKPTAEPKSAETAATDSGTRPEALSEARDGGADDLKKIKGVGPKLEQLLNSLGFYHFDQIAGWNAPEVAWMDQNLKGFKGRVSRDNWVEQAKILAAGGTTEFAKKVDKGSVY